MANECYDANDNFKPQNVLLKRLLKKMFTKVVSFAYFVVRKNKRN